jgi:hypothetical protein
MKIIPRKIHGFLDYLVGIVLIAVPWLFGFADDGPATYIPVALGAGALVYSIVTNYEWGLVRLIPFHAAPAARCPLWSVPGDLPVAVWILEQSISSSSHFRAYRDGRRNDDERLIGSGRNVQRSS